MKKAMCMATSAIMAVTQMGTFPAAAKSERMLPAIGTLTQRQTNLVARAILDGISRHESSISFDFEKDDRIPATNETMDSLLLTLSTTVTQNEECILVKKNTMGTQLGSADGVGYIKGISLYYLVDDTAYDEAYSFAMTTLDDISSGVRPDWSNVEKALYLHDELGERYNYDTEYDVNGKLCYTAYGLMSEGKAVCEGYAWLYNILLSREGIYSVECSSDVLWHIWNLVEIAPNKWAHVDVTWDDTWQGHPGLIDHKSFLKSNEGMMISNHTSNDWVLTTGETLDSYNVVNDYDNGFWADTRIAVQPYQDGWLVLNPSKQAVNPTGHFCYCVYNERRNAYDMQELTTISEMWHGERQGASQTYFKGSYIVPVVDTNTNCIFYTMPDDVRAMYNGGWYTVCSLNEEQKKNGHIFGMYADGDILHYYVSKSLTGVSVVYTYNMQDFYNGVNQWSVPAATELQTTTAVEVTSATTETTLFTTQSVETATETTASTTSDAVSETVWTEISMTETEAEVTTETSETMTSEASTTETTTSVLTDETTETTCSETAYTDTTAAETSVTETSESSETTYTGAVNYELVSRNGDVNDDGELTIIDIIIVSQYLHGVNISDSYIMEAADVYVDGQVDVFDLGILKQQLLRL